ncbi:MAG: IS4 family transposase [Armatimonadetes bacterium]|nr:IS4 family transposase [Armatimonadota bacterium]
MMVQVADAMARVLNEEANELARETQFVKRERKLTGAIFAQALVFGWMADPEATVVDLSQAAAAVGVEISPQGLDQRFTEEAAEFLRQVLEAGVREVIRAEPVPIPILQRFNGVYVQDSSVVTLPEGLVAEWEGCTGAALKIQVRWDLLEGALVHLELRPGKESDRAAPVQEEPLPKGALRLADLGYFDLDQLKAIDDQEAYYLSRAWIQCVVYDEQGQRWELGELLRRQQTASVDLPVELGAKHRLPCRLLAVRVPPEVAAERRRKIRAEAQRRGRTPSQRQLELADWTILFTNVPGEKLSLEEAVVVARVRWQIELLFKLWKSHARIDEWRTENPWRILCELYAKLLGMLLFHWVLVVSAWGYPNRSLFQAAQTVRKHAMSLACALASGLRQRLIGVLHTLQRCLAAGCRINKRKDKPHTYQLLLALTEPP